MPRNQIYFTAGPSELYPKFEQYLQEFVDLQLGSISHRSGQFKKIYQHAGEQLRILLNIPSESTISFTGSASEIWEKSIQGLVEFESFHLVNGSFSDKYYKYAKSLLRHSTKFEKELGNGFTYSEISVPEYAELLCVTQNETSTGVQMREADIHKLKRSNASKLISVDMVSSAPMADLDLSLIDSAFFSIQKSFGLPAGLGVWITNEKCLEKAINLKNKGLSIGAHHDLPTLVKNAKEFQNPATPNVMAIYLLGKVVEDMNKTGISTLRKLGDSKAKRLYNYFENKEGYNLSVENPELRSKTVAVINTEKPSAEIISALKAKNIIIGSGYGPKKDSQIRISNFISNSEEQFESLFKALENI